MLEAYLNILVVFSLVLVGYLLSVHKIFDKKTSAVFSTLVLNWALPFNMFLNITLRFTKSEFLHLFKGMLLPILSILITFIISNLYVKISKVPATRKGVFRTMFTTSNTIFMGLPINIAIFGEKSVPYALLYYICNTTFFWTAGIYMIGKDSTDLEMENTKITLPSILRMLASPAMLGFIIGLIWMLLELPNNQTSSNPLILAFYKFSSYLSGLTTPLSMFIIGMLVYQTGFKNLRMNKDTFGVLIGRYLISPAIVILLSYFIKVPELMLKVFIVQSAMPAQNAMPILVQRYQADVEFATTTQAYTFILYLFVIPILLALVK